MATLTRLSPAKINLTLWVGPLRDDGFHELESLVAQVGLYDEVSVAPRDDGRIVLSCDDPSIPTGDSNLVIRAAHALASFARIENPCAQMGLRKRIPAGAGLGGGSSNAAAALHLLNELWDLDLPAAKLAEIGATIGSDVPLFFSSPLCVMRGRGELIEPRDIKLGAWVVLVLPPVHCSTTAVYAAWDRLPEHPQRPPIDEILSQAGEPGWLMEVLFNDLEPAAFAAYPELSKAHARLQQLAAGPVRMTGSGSAFFRLFAGRAEADGFARRIEAERMRSERCLVLA